MRTTTTTATTTTPTGPAAEAEPVDAAPDTSTDVFHALVHRLSEQSVRKNFDAYLDVPWDDHEVDPADPRWELRADDPLGATQWYRSLPQPERARLGLFSVAAKMKVGLEFENILAQGLLKFIATLPNGAPEFRYAHHEIIEEGQHQLMFQEFVNRSGIDARGISGGLPAIGARLVPTLGRIFPPLFFMFVLGGEDPIDHVQRESLKRGDAHPLLQRIMKIHVTEEARHLSFARHYLKEQVRDMSALERVILAIGTPVILGEMGGMMLQPSRQMIREFQIPDEVLREAYHDNPEYQQGAATALKKVRKLARELGIITSWSKPIWKAKKIWADD